MIVVTVAVPVWVPAKETHDKLAQQHNEATYPALSEAPTPNSHYCILQYKRTTGHNQCPSPLEGVSGYLSATSLPILFGCAAQRNKNAL